MKNKIKLGLILFIIGIAGIATMLTVNISTANIPKEVFETVPSEYIRYLILINPTIMLIIATIVGTVLYDKLNFSVPTISNILKLEIPKLLFKQQIKSGVLYGAISGLFIFLLGFIYNFLIPQELILFENKIEMTLLARIGYGGITEEILMRFGLMTFVVWIIFKVRKKLSNSTYWLGIIIVSILFSLGHFPLVFTIIENPSITLLTFILIGNLIPSVLFGWLYWRNGLEASFIGHISAHILLILTEYLF